MLVSAEGPRSSLSRGLAAQAFGVPRFVSRRLFECNSLRLFVPRFKFSNFDFRLVDIEIIYIES